MKNEVQRVEPSLAAKTQSYPFLHHIISLLNHCGGTLAHSYLQHYFSSLTHKQTFVGIGLCTALLRSCRSIAIGVRSELCWFSCDRCHVAWQMAPQMTLECFGTAVRDRLSDCKVTEVLWLQNRPKSSALHHRVWKLVWGADMSLVFTQRAAVFYDQTSPLRSRQSKEHCCRSLWFVHTQLCKTKREEAFSWQLFRTSHTCSVLLIV